MGRDPAEIKYTVFIPTKLTDDQGTVAGIAEYIIDRIGEFAEAGVHEIMLAPWPSDAESLKCLDEES